jgi:pimeloyl-ACP methyl ester carboxylesterase
MYGGNNKKKPLLLIHGLFQTGMMWRRVVPKLMEDHYVIVPDVRGFGKTEKPSDVKYMDKKSQAKDIYELVLKLQEELGIAEKMVVFSHDRGARVGRRFALDYPELLLGISIMEMIPTEFIYQEMTVEEIGDHHWDQLFKLASPISEKLLCNDEGTQKYVDHFYNRSEGFLQLLKDDGVYDYYMDAMKSDGAMMAMLNDYRAAFTYDVPRLREELESGIKLQMPALILWGEKNGNLCKSPAMDIWEPRCTEMEGHGIKCGHYIPEEKPEETLGYLIPFADKCFENGVQKNI